MLAKPYVTSVIIGAKRVEQLDDNLGAADVVPTGDELARLDAVSALPPSYPGWMIAGQEAGGRSLLRAPRRSSSGDVGPRALAIRYAAARSVKAMRRRT
ncbi:hypothetical protein [Burkholderia sp. AU45388]|uniref:hypothetical protein n=1 Tax=Burkholderia sp. AU45388 TaxID=3059206 RepID=UPI0034636D12